MLYAHERERQPGWALGGMIPATPGMPGMRCAELRLGSGSNWITSVVPSHDGLCSFWDQDSFHCVITI